MSLIEIDIDGPVRTITLNRPDKHNALSADMMEDLKSVFERDPPTDERVAVLRGAGRSFCSGLELSSTDGVSNREAQRIEHMFDAVQRYPLPVVALVHGRAIAGGCELALHCDFIVAEKDAAFAMPLAQIGVSTTWFLTKKIVETAGAHIGREFLLLGEPLPAERLHQLGIVARIADPGELDEVGRPLIDRLAANAPLSLRSMKRLLVAMNDHMMAADYGDLDRTALATYESADSKEGIAARLAKRSPSFKGR
jgi:enoyl-CoA hydratase/carnithine racemase